VSATTFTQTGAVVEVGAARRRGRRRLVSPPAWAVAAIVLAVAFAGLLATYRAPALAVPAARAASLVRHDGYSRQLMAHTGANRLVVYPLDGHFDQVFGYRGQRVAFIADVSVLGHVQAASELIGPAFAFGSDIANAPIVLALLCAVFALMTGVWPLRRLRNLDVLAAASLVSAVVLFNDMYLKAMVLTAYPALGYLVARTGWRALGRSRPAAPSVPLFEHVTAGWSSQARGHVLRLGAVTAALIVAMVGFSSLHVVDVGVAVMEGATVLLHGVLPYGHIPDILHGDTYPLGSYLLFVPVALRWPVYDAWGNANPTLAIAALAAAATAGGLVRAAGGRARIRARFWRRPAANHLTPADPEVEQAGLRAAIAWLAFPCLLVTVSTGTTDVLLGTMLLGALLLWRRPALATAALAAGAWFKLAPAMLLPLSLARLRGRGLVRGIAVTAAVCVPMAGLLLALGGIHGVGDMLRAMMFQQTRRSPHSLWAVIGSVPLQQLAEAATLALIAGAAVRLRRDSALAADRQRMAALFAAILLGVQISANYWSSMYLAWVVPLLCVALWMPAQSPEPARS
jgi:hypothetical protein